MKEVTIERGTRLRSITGTLRIVDGIRDGWVDYTNFANKEGFSKTIESITMLVKSGLYRIEYDYSIR